MTLDVLPETACVRGCCKSNAINLQVSKAELGLGEEIARGGTSKVLRGTYQGNPVAVKLPSLPKQDDLDRFHAELQIMQRVGSHEHVAGVVAARGHPPDYSFVMPLYKCNLAECIYTSTPGLKWSPSWARVVQIGAQVAAGVGHLHSLGLVHRDLKPANILMDQHGTARVSDLGLAQYASVLSSEVAENGNIRWKPRGKPSGGFHKQMLAGTLEYMSPEVLMKAGASTASDVFALATLINEIATSVVPYSDCTKDNPACHTVLDMGYGRQELAAAVAGDGLRPIPAADTPPALLALLNQCWALDPKERPDIHTIQARLAELAEVLGEEGGVEEGGSDFKEVEVEGGGGMQEDEEMEEAEEEVEFNVPESWTPPRTFFPLKVRVGSYAAFGRRGADKMEDRHLTTVLGPASGSLQTPQGRMHLGAVFDGHRGSQAAEFCRVSLVSHLARAAALTPSPAQALSSAFLSLDQAYCAQEERERRAGGGMEGQKHAGCTALAALLYGTKLLLANAGDCRAVLCRKGEAIQLTRDHTAHCEQERQRIVDFGGKVELKDSWRIGDAGLQVSRAIGDADVKGDGVTAEPEILEQELTPDDEFLVLACDGLPEVISNEQVVQIVKDTVKHPAMVAQRLVTDAINAGSKDNITVIVMFLQPSVGTLERVFLEK